MRRTLASSGTSLLSDAPSARAEATSPALPTAKQRRSMPRVMGSGLLGDGVRTVVDVDEVPPVLPEHRPPVADHAALRHVERDAVKDVLVRHVGETETLGFAECGEPLRTVGERLDPVERFVECRQPDPSHVLAADLAAVVLLESAFGVGCGR